MEVLREKSETGDRVKNIYWNLNRKEKKKLQKEEKHQKKKIIILIKIQAHKAMLILGEELIQILI